MIMTQAEIFITILVCAACTFLTRALPFLIFRDQDHMPVRMQFLSDRLPMAIMLLLVLYCLRNTNIARYPYAIPEIAGVLCVIVIHLWKRNMIISIAGGTILYMILIQQLT